MISHWVHTLWLIVYYFQGVFFRWIAVKISLIIG